MAEHVHRYDIAKSERKVREHEQAARRHTLSGNHSLAAQSEEKAAKHRNILARKTSEREARLSAERAQAERNPYLKRAHLVVAHAQHQMVLAHHRKALDLAMVNGDEGKVQKHSGRIVVRQGKHDGFRGRHGDHFGSLEQAQHLDGDDPGPRSSNSALSSNGSYPSFTSRRDRSGGLSHRSRWPSGDGDDRRHYTHDGGRYGNSRSFGRSPVHQQPRDPAHYGRGQPAPHRQPRRQPSYHEDTPSDDDYTDEDPDDERITDDEDPETSRDEDENGRRRERW